MDSRLLALKLFLSELGIPREIETLDDRKKVQKAIYLGQRAGVDLGYRFGWYLMGPYSPALTRDYYALSEALELGEGAEEGKVLHRSIRDRLGRIRPILCVPEDTNLEQSDWLELLASYHFLRSVRRLSDDEAVQLLKEQKPKLVGNAGNAARELARAGLIKV